MKIKFPEQKPRRLTLKGWAAMEDLQRKIDSSAKEGNWSDIPELIFQTSELCFKRINRNSFWIESMELYLKSLKANSPTKKFPILSSKEKSKPMPWEYQGRTWYFWLNTFAKLYGWEEKQIATLDIDDAIGLYQETIIDEQLEKEWDWGLSENAYEYNKTTKKSTFKPMPRPDWMARIVGKPKAVKTRKIAKNALPVGEIIILDEKTTE